MIGAGPRALLVHRSAGRARLRLPSERGNEAFFAALGERLARAEAVCAVEVAPLTGSVVIRFAGELDDVLRFATREQLFELEPRDAAEDGALAEIREALHALDARLRERTGGRWGVRTLVFYGLVGGAAVQVRRGNVLPAATALLFQALALLQGPTTEEAAANVERRPR